MDFLVHAQRFQQYLVGHLKLESLACGGFVGRYEFTLDIRDAAAGLTSLSDERGTEQVKTD